MLVLRSVVIFLLAFSQKINESPSIKPLFLISAGDSCSFDGMGRGGKKKQHQERSKTIKKIIELAAYVLRNREVIYLCFSRHSSMFNSMLHSLITCNKQVVE